MADLQGIVDALAIELDRPIGVDDRRFRALAYSSHVDGVDPVRLASILQREAPRDVIAWLESLGIAHADSPVHVPANAGFGMAARVCVPIRFDGALLGYLWLIDEPRPLDERELAEASRASAELAVALFRAQRLEHEDRERERELLTRLADPHRDDGAAAAEELLRDGFLATARAHGVLVAQAFRADGAQAPDEVRVRLAAAAEHVRRGVAPRHLLVHVAGEQIVALLACAERDELERRGRALAAAVERNLADCADWIGRVGAGVERAAAAELPRALAEARRALRVAQAIGARERFTPWSELGAYRTLARLVPEGAAPPLPDALLRMLAADEADVLVPTLERFLDAAGDARAAAERLFIHRSSLYARLHRIEQVAGVDLRDGDVRLELHLGLRLLRLRGDAPPWLRGVPADGPSGGG